MLQLVQCLRLVSESLQGDMAYDMEKALDHLQSPEKAAEQVLETMLANDRSVAHAHTHTCTESGESILTRS